MKEQEMETTYLGDHIWSYPAALPKEICEDYIHMFERLHDCGMTYSRESSILDKKDFASNIELMQDKKLMEDEGVVFDDEFHFRDNLVKYLLDTLKYECVPHYCSNYNLNMDKHVGIFQGKIQRTKPAGGYHTWHWEDTKDQNQRVLAWAVFLNDVDEGGELEFIYQSLRVKPKQGDIIIWPSAFTHTHRGNPPLTSTKYIGTGWIEYV